MKKHIPLRLMVIDAIRRLSLRDVFVRSTGGLARMAFKDLRGVRYGKLTCIEPTGEKGKDGCMSWRCICDCGNECTATTAQLGRGDKKSCGCLQRKPQMVQNGQRFGMLVVLGYAGIQNRRRCWRCQCDCGNECIVSGTSLNSGKQKSCGCIRPLGPKELVGQRFGSLLVKEYAGNREGRQYWLCQGDCGNTTEVWQSNLLSGHTKSCGCRQKESYRKNLKLIDGTSVTQIEKRRNTPIKSNTSGYTGVYWKSKTQMWSAQITFKGKTYYLGSFSDITDAVKARKRGEEKLFDNFLAWYYEDRGTLDP